MRHRFSFLAAIPQSATLIGTSSDRRFILGAFEYSYRCWQSGTIAISFAPSPMPAAILLQPQENVPAHAVYGFVVSPIGFTFEPAQAGCAAALLRTARRHHRIYRSNPGCNRFKLQFDFGAGVQLKFAERRVSFFR